MKVLLFSGSLRSGSLNKKLALVAQKIFQDSGHTADFADLKSFSIPVYDGDIEAVGIPEGVTKFGALIQACDALVIASPEYNSSTAGSLKNAIDWLSRLKPVPVEKKPILLLGASPGALGATRALAYTRVPLDALAAFVYPQNFGLPKAHEAFGATGELNDTATKERLKKLIDGFTGFAAKFSNK